jgi:hypothetical protein
MWFLCEIECKFDGEKLSIKCGNYNEMKKI